MIKGSCQEVFEVWCQSTRERRVDDIQGLSEDDMISSHRGNKSRTLKTCIRITSPSQLSLFVTSCWGSMFRRTLNASSHTGRTDAVASVTACMC